MLLNVAYYAIYSYPLFHIMFHKNSMQFIIQHEIHASEYTVLVHRPFSTTLPQITRTESDSPL